MAQNTLIRFAGNTVTNSSSGAQAKKIYFTGIPQLLSIESYPISATTAQVIIRVNGLTASADTQWYITVMGETITNVLDPEKAVGKYFYVSSNANSTMLSIAKALSSCSTIAANFDVFKYADTMLIAKAAGPCIDTTTVVQTNIPSNIIEVTATDGTTNDDFYNKKLTVDLLSDSTYITSLEKNHYGGEVTYFDLNPVLTSIAKYDEVVNFYFYLNAVDKNFSSTSLPSIAFNHKTYVAPGFQTKNHHRLYISRENFTPAQEMETVYNQERVTEGLYNSDILYVAREGNNFNIPFSFYRGSLSSYTFNIDFVDSAGNVLDTTSSAITFDTSKYIFNNTFELSGNPTYIDDVFYIDINIPGGTKVRYNVIKAAKMSDTLTRLKFRNSMGGFSFFDFTGEKTETNEVETETYEKANSDSLGNGLYYTNLKESNERVYSKTPKYTYTVKSHLIEEGGQHIFEDLLMTPEVYIGEQNVFIDSVQVDKINNTDGVYQATVKYHLGKLRV